MANYNKITVVGHLGKDPEVRFLKDGTTVANFSIASSFTRGDTQTTTWYSVSIFGKKGEAVNTYLSKGSKVLVEGRHQMREYLNKEGIKQFANEIVANDVVFLDSIGAAKGVAATASQSDIEDDLPF